jgi:succinoglycan biosynthesis transport protein ExoP
MINLNSKPRLNGGPPEAPLRSLSNFLLRNRWLVGAFLPVVLLATAVFLILARPVYEAASSVRIDEDRSNLAVLDVLKTLSSGSEINTEMEELRSRSLAEQVVDSLGLQLRVLRPRRVAREELFSAVNVARDAPERVITLTREGNDRFRVRSSDGGSAGTLRIGEPLHLHGVSLALSPGAARFDRIVLDVETFYTAVRRFADVVTISRPNREANIVVIRYKGSDSLLVHAVPDVMAAQFIARRHQVRKTESKSAIRFLGEQLDTLNGQLTFAENRLRAFREREHIVSPQAQAEAQVTRLADLQAHRDMLNVEHEGLAELLAEVASTPVAREGDMAAYRRMLAFPTLLRSPAVGELLNNLAAVENQRAELLIRYTMDNPDVQVLTERIREIEQQLASVALTYHQGLQSQISSFDARLRSFGNELARVPATEIAFARLLREAKLYEEIATLLQTRLKEAEISAALEDPTVRIVDPAIPPDKPIWPKPVLSLLLATLVGLSLGVGTAFAREHMDTTIHTREDLQLLAAGVPVLGTIPRIRQAVATNGGTSVPRGPGDRAAPELQSRLVTGRDPRNPASEAYRSLRTNITFVQAERIPRTLVFTSPTPGDGKSTSAANLAITLAQQELRCLLIDADMRRGVLHEVFRTAREPGLSNLLLDRVTTEQVVQRIEVGEGAVLSFIPMGTIPPNPAELLASPQMRALVQRLESEYDAILFDAPPLTVVTDAALLGTNADGVILVARAGATERGAISYSVEQLQNVRAPLLGAVLNDIDVKKDRYYGSYGAASSYYAAEEEGKRFAWPW